MRVIIRAEGSAGSDTSNASHTFKNTSRIISANSEEDLPSSASFAKSSAQAPGPMDGFAANNFLQIIRTMVRFYSIRALCGRLVTYA